MLLQQRAHQKYHSAGLGTNACCSHPRPGEDTRAAAIRRLKEELGFTTRLEKIFDFTYRSEFENGLTEFEFDHVFVGTYDATILPNKKEICDYCFKSLHESSAGLQSNPLSERSSFPRTFR